MIDADAHQIHTGAPIRPTDGAAAGPVDLTRGDRFPPVEYIYAFVLALLPCSAYIATMYPELSGVGDAAKFAFVGKVLGTPHAPGYPLYVMVSHLFSYVPWGTLAHRMNGLSAILGACAVGLSYLLMRRLAVGRVAAAGAALALGFGDAFWSRSLYAKGYTLQAALMALGMLALLRWGQTLRPRHLYWAVVVFAIASGNHLTVIGLLPALVLFPLVTAPRSVLRPTVILVVGLIVAAGLTQYGLIWLRTVQGAPYLEARASNLGVLWGVMTARRFAHEISAYSLPVLFSTRVPLVAGLIAKELGVAGLGVLVLGFVALVVRRPRQALLLTLGALGIAALTANMSSAEDQGFLLTAFVLLWPMVGVGLDLIFATMTRLKIPFAAAIAIIVAAALPAGQVIGNYAANNHHTDTAESDYFSALFRSLPDNAAIVDDEYRVNMMLLYKMLGEGVTAERGITLVPDTTRSLGREKESGRAVFAFERVRDMMAPFGVRFAPFDFAAPPSADQLRATRRVFRLVSVPTCQDIGNRGWIDVGAAARPRGRLAIRIDNFNAFDSSVVIWATATPGSRSTLVGGSGAGRPILQQTTYDRAKPEDARRLAAQIAADQVSLPAEVLDSPVLVRAEVQVNDRGAFSMFGLDLGGVTNAAVARAMVDRNEPPRATVCSHELADVDAWRSGTARVEIAPDSFAVSYAQGWYKTEHAADGHAFRWTDERATVLVPINQPGAATLTVSGEPLAYPGRTGGSVSLIVNGTQLESRPLTPGVASFAWEVPVDRWRSGINEVTLVVTGATSPSKAGLSPDDRTLGLAVSAITLKAAGR